MTTTEFENIVLQLRPLMMRIAYDFFRNEEDAEDAVQEVLLKMWKRKWLPGDDIKAMAVVATKNQCVSMARKHRLRQHLSLEDARGHASPDRADNVLIINEQTLRIEQAIGTLTKSEQRIIRLKQEQNIDADEISLITGIQVKSVRSMLSMARKKLIEKIKL